MKDDFWELLDQLLTEKKLILDRPKGPHHPTCPDCIYPLDYGYLEGARSADGEGIDVWMGAAGRRTLTGLIVSLDASKNTTPRSNSCWGVQSRKLKRSSHFIANIACGRPTYHDPRITNEHDP